MQTTPSKLLYDMKYHCGLCAVAVTLESVSSTKTHSIVCVTVLKRCEDMHWLSKGCLRPPPREQVVEEDVRKTPDRVGMSF